MSANIEHARKQFNTLIDMMNSNELKFTKHEDDLSISSGFITEDLPVEYFIRIDAEIEMAVFISKLPFTMPEEKRVDGAIAVCVANNGIVNGNFDYDINDGEIVFRLTTSFKSGSVLSEDLFEYMIMASASMVDRYNDKFFMLAKGMMNIQQFIEQENN